MGNDKGNALALLHKSVHQALDRPDDAGKRTALPQVIHVKCVFQHLGAGRLDLCRTTRVKPRLKGRAFLIRYADDFVMGFSREEDARRVPDVLPKRFGKYGLTLHSDKTRRVPFQRPPRRSARRDSTAGPQPESFDLPGFTHYGSLSRRGHGVVKRKTAKSRLTRAPRTVAHGCRTHRHQPMAEPHRTLSRTLKGHFA